MAQFPKQMQVISVQQPGANSLLTIEQQALPEPSPGQLLLQVKAAGVNRADLMQRQGYYPPPPGESEILGLEVAGIVVQAGCDTDKHWLGAEVFGIVAGGGYAEYALLQTSHAMKKPRQWSWQQAGAAAETMLTAYQLLFTIGQLQQGQRVLLHAGASGVGTCALQLAALTGAEVAVTVGRPEKAQACLALGAKYAFNYRQQNFSDELATYWPTGADIILDPVAGYYINDNIKVLADDGAIIVYALMGGRMVEKFDLAPLFKKRGRLLCSTLRNRSNRYKARLTEDFVNAFGKEMTYDSLKPLVNETFNWHDVEQAHIIMANNDNIGKLVLLF